MKWASRICIGLKKKSSLAGKGLRVSSARKRLLTTRCSGLATLAAELDIVRLHTMPVFPLPFSTFTVGTSRSPSEVEACLRAHVTAPLPPLTPRDLFSLEVISRRLQGPEPTAWFEGSVDNGRFAVHRHISYRNSFLPYLFGRVSMAPSGTVVRVLARPHWIITTITVLWLIGVSCVLLGQQAPLREEPLILLMPIFAVAGYVGAFVPEAIKARRLFKELLS